MITLYTANMRMAVQTQIQYRAAKIGRAHV